MKSIRRIETVLPHRQATRDPRHSQQYVLISLVILGLLVFRVRPPEFAIAFGNHLAISDSHSHDKRQSLEVLTDVLAVARDTFRFEARKSHLTRLVSLALANDFLWEGCCHNRPPPLT